MMTRSVNSVKSSFRVKANNSLDKFDIFANVRPVQPIISNKSAKKKTFDEIKVLLGLKQPTPTPKAKINARKIQEKPKQEIRGQIKTQQKNQESKCCQQKNFKITRNIILIPKQLPNFQSEKGQSSQRQAISKITPNQQTQKDIQEQEKKVENQKSRIPIRTMITRSASLKSSPNEIRMAPSKKESTSKKSRKSNKIKEKKEKKLLEKKVSQEKEKNQIKPGK